MPHDPTLALPPQPLSAPALHGPGDTLARAGAARPRPFLLTAPGATARGVETRGVDAVEGGGRLLLGGLSVPSATCGNVLLAPAEARRELFGPAGSVMEVLLVTPDGLTAQWRGPAGAPGEPLNLELLVPGSAWRADGQFLATSGPDGARLVQITPGPEWLVREEPGRVAVRVTVRSAAEPLRLLAAAGARAADAEASLGRLARGGEARAEADAVRCRTRRLAMRTGVEELDDALAWAVARVEAATGPDAAHVHDLAAGEPFPLDPDARRAWTLLGAVAAGGPLDPPTAWGGDELGLLALARLALWRGRPLPAGVDAAVSGPESTPVEPARTVARRAALLALADAIEPWQGRPRAQELRARASPGAIVQPSSAARRLPTLGAPAAAPSDAAAATLASALELPWGAPFRAPAEDPPPGALRALTAWACFNAGDLDRGFSLLRRHLADGFAHGAGLWPDGSRVHDPAAAALVPLVFLEGLLGGRGDAHYGRLRLAPRLPPHWRRLVVTGIALGGAEVRLEYESEGGAHRFRVVQEAGAVPAMLIFEPVLAVRADAAVRIDGRKAEVDVIPVSGRTQLRVQLPLDREREIEIV